MQKIQQGDEQIGDTDKQEIRIPDIFLRIPGYHEDGKTNDDAECLSEGMKKQIVNPRRKIQPGQCSYDDSVVDKQLRLFVETIFLFCEYIQFGHRNAEF
jgi:hypothetical protein